MLPLRQHAGTVYGIIEKRGRGIEKICDACRELGTGQPVYELAGNGLRVFFPALKRALIPRTDTSNGQDVQKSDQKDVQKKNLLKEQIIGMIAAQRGITVTEIANRLEVSYKTVQRAVDSLKSEGHVKRSGGRRYGCWEIIERS